jgi:ATP-dependent Clp protease ATP-binding subunit ClpA
MFDAFSIRARQIVFAARFKAGEGGATSIDVEHFLLGVVLEDQGMLGENLFSALQGQVGAPVNDAPSHIPFFSQEAAKNVLTRIEATFIAAKPVGLMTEIPLSPALERAFAAAKKVQVRFHNVHIEPLHLLAAILDDAPSRCAKLLQQNGITKEQVLGQLRGTAES